MIKSFREAGYDIVYMDETWVNKNHCTDYMWLPKDGHYSSPGDGHHPFIWPETLHRSRQSSLRVPACKTIKRLPLPKGIFRASDPSFGRHI
jgi:hypothetical protein